jgi:phosphatidylserine synthase
MNLERFFIGLPAAAALLLLFLVAVREGRFASPRTRAGGVATIALLALLIWLLPFR